MKLLSAFFLGVLCMSTVNATEQKKEAAQQYVVEVDEAVRLFMPTINSGDGVKIRNLSLKMNELVEKGEPLGPTTLDLPFGHCSAMGSMARELWTALAFSRGGSDDERRIKSFEEMFLMMQEGCVAAIEEFGQEKKPVCDENGKCLTPTVIHVEKR